MITIVIWGAIIEIISMLLFLIAVFYVYNIRSLTKGINGWNYIAAGFLLIIFRNFFGFFLRNKIEINMGTTRLVVGLAEPIILLLITILFIIGFYKLNKDFEEIRGDGLLKKEEKRKRGR